MVMNRLYMGFHQNYIRQNKKIVGDKMILDYNEDIW